MKFCEGCTVWAQVQSVACGWPVVPAPPAEGTEGLRSPASGRAVSWLSALPPAPRCRALRSLTASPRVWWRRCRWALFCAGSATSRAGPLCGSFRVSPPRAPQRPRLRSGFRKNFFQLQLLPGQSLPATDFLSRHLRETCGGECHGHGAAGGCRRRSALRSRPLCAGSEEAADGTLSPVPQRGGRFPGAQS